MRINRARASDRQIKSKIIKNLDKFDAKGRPFYPEYLDAPDEEKEGVKAQIIDKKMGQRYEQGKSGMSLLLKIFLHANCLK